MSTDIASMIEAADPTGAIITLEPGRLYVESRPWDLRGRDGLSIRGQNSRVAFNFPTETPPAVAIDASGAVGLHFEGWKMSLASKSGRPAVGLLLARNEANHSAGSHHFDRWSIVGWYRKAAVVALASEMNVWDHCWLSNSYPNAVVYWTGRYNGLDLRSQFGRFGDGSTNTCHTFTGTGFGHYGMVYGDNRNGVGIFVGTGTHDLSIRSGTMSMRLRSAGGYGGSCAIQLGSMGGKPVRNVVLDCASWETEGAENSVYVGSTVYGLTIRDCLMMSQREFWRMHPPAEVIGLSITGGRIMPGLGGA